MVQCSLNRISCMDMALNWESEIFYWFFKLSLFVQLSLFLSIFYGWQRQLGFWKSDSIPDGFGEYH
jgi:hypothetical protein